MLGHAFGYALGFYVRLCVRWAMRWAMRSASMLGYALGHLRLARLASMIGLGRSAGNCKASAWFTRTELDVICNETEGEGEDHQHSPIMDG